MSAEGRGAPCRADPPPSAGTALATTSLKGLSTPAATAAPLRSPGWQRPWVPRSAEDLLATTGPQGRLLGTWRVSVSVSLRITGGSLGKARWLNLNLFPQSLFFLMIESRL